MKPFAQKIGILSLILAIALIFSGCSLLPDEEKNIVPDKPVARSINELSTDRFFVKSGDYFYQLPSGSFRFDPDEEANADPERVITFLTGKDDQLIPTLYEGDELTFYTDKPLPESFKMERFTDNGYSFGIYGMEESAAGVSATIEDGNYAKGSDFENTVSDAVPVNKSTVLLINSIGKERVTGNDLSCCGSIMGLSKDSSYATDLYVGTMHYGLSLKADTHIFSSYEIYSINEYDLNPSGYASLKLPDGLLPGYYYLSRKGMFRYINRPASEGEDGLSFNEPYFYEDEEGTLRPYLDNGNSMQEDLTE